MFQSFEARLRWAGPAALLLSLALAVAVASAAGTLDQFQDNYTGGTAYIWGPAAAPESQAQTFTAGLSGPLDQVDLYITGDPANNLAVPLTVEIRNVDASGVPGSSVLAATSVNAALLTSPGWAQVPFASPTSVVAGTSYAIVAYTDQNNGFLWGRLFDYTDGYGPGHPFTALDWPPSSWTAAPDGDLAFRTHVTLPPVTPTADLSVTLSGPSSASRKSSVSFALVVQNAGPDAAGNVVLTDNLPYGVQVTAVSTSQGTCTPPSKSVTKVTCNLGDITSGGGSSSTVTVKISTQVSNGGNLNYVASVKSDALDPNPSNNTASLTTVVTK